MDYYEAISFITNTYKFGKKAGLERIIRLLELLGSPQKGLKFVHIAGTNGKGSVSAYMTEILMAAGYKTGLFISPYLQRFSERVRVNNAEIDDDSLVRHLVNIKEKFDIVGAEFNDYPTEFEVLTALGMLHYREHNCDAVVLETGMGGIIDSTNAIEDSLVSIITTIGFDHMQYLGDTLTLIAEKKAGIIKRNGAVALYPQNDEVLKVFEAECKAKNAELNKLKYEDINIKSENIEGTVFDFRQYKDISIRLLGQYQPFNAALAVMAAEVLNNKGFAISEGNIREGLLKTRWPGRFEVVNKSPMVIIDGAHNTEGALAFASGLKNYFGGKKLIFITGVLQDKEYDKMLEPFIPMAKEFLVITPDNPRALPAMDLKAYLNRFHNCVSVCADIVSAIETALGKASCDDVICAFGSLYYIGYIRDYFGLV